MCAVIRHAALVAFLVFVSSACKQRPARPGPPPPPGGSPQSIEIGGSVRLQKPGEASQLVAVAIYANGVRVDATSQNARFSIRDGVNVARVTPNGYLTATGYGKTTVYLACLGQSASVEVRVVPDGMFFVTGRVTQDGPGQLPVLQARVEMIMPGGSVSTVTDSDGRYSLIAAGTATLHVEATNFYPQSVPIVVTGDAQFDIPLRRTTEVLGGSYALIFTASPSCSLPPDVTTRQYIAAVQDWPSNLVVRLSGAQFEGDAAFGGSRNGDAVVFSIGEPDWFGGGFLEVLGQGKYLGFTGEARGRIEGEKIRTTFKGTVNLYSMAGPWESALVASCSAPDHRFDFVR